MKVTERSKTALQSHIRDSQRASECINEESIFRVTVEHNYNEHNRLWNNPWRDNRWRDTLTCRENRACDFAAGVAGIEDVVEKPRLQELSPREGTDE